MMWKKVGKMIRKRLISIFLIFILLFICVFSVGCKEKNAVNMIENNKEVVLKSGEYQVYYLNDKKTTLKSKIVTPETTDDIIGIADELMAELNHLMLNEIVDGSMKLDVLGLIVTGDILIVDLDKNILNIPDVTRILLRACTVLTLTQIPGINFVQITVNGQTIKDEAGNKIGNMKADDFVNFKDNFPDTRKVVKYILYYADSEGKMLRKKEFTSYYDYTISYEKYVMDKLLAGVLEDDVEAGYRSTLPSETIIDMIYTKDGVCYVDFDESILTKVRVVPTELMLYSIVNTLSELSYVTKVKFSVEGEGEVSLFNEFDLSEPISRNLDLVIKEGEENK